MARVDMDSVFHGVRGKFGDVVVFKMLRGRTLATRPPSRPVSQSVKQQENRSRFRQASRWAKAMLADPARRIYYQKKAVKLGLPNAYTAAVADYMRPVSVTKIKTTATDVVYQVDKKGFDMPSLKITAHDPTGHPCVTGIGGDSRVQLSLRDVARGVTLRVDTAGAAVKLIYGVSAYRPPLHSLTQFSIF